ncbi:hypothetical protein [Microbacterium yannicii]|uniref:hypothetical protein n=1 Tax=Microbacterium yannicii TaxID=671622 RepID=UPI001887B9BD|nr:hypothetical protein [Microbacterium yannicii]MCO5952800.1 hypothetical protein [Microbacterium yannicii]
MAAPLSSIEATGGEHSSTSISMLMHWAWSPLGLLLMIPVPALVGSLAIPDQDFRQMWGQPSFLTSDFALAIVLVTLVIALVFALAAPLYVGSTRVTLTSAQVSWINHAVIIIATITFAAYGAWILLGVARGLTPSVLISALNGEFGVMSTIKNRLLAPVSGITTWMHLGVLLGPLIILRRRTSARSGYPLLTALFALAVFRAFFFSERLAIVELVASTLIASLILRDRAPRLVATVPRTIATFVLAWGALLIFFAILEYNRSWANYYAARGDGDIVSFSWNRLLGYYATAVNNGVLFGEAAPPDLNFASLIPGISELPLVSGSSRFRQYEQLLEQSSNPEFNNISGLAVPLASLGVWGGAVFLCVLAVTVVVIAGQVRRGGIPGMLIYCVIAVGILELTRIYYFSSTRFLVIVLGLGVLWLTYPRRATRSRRVGTRVGARPRPTRDGLRAR